MTLADQARDLDRMAAVFDRGAGDWVYPDDDGRKVLARRGYELKANTWFGRASDGTLQPAFLDTEVFGPHASAAVRATVQPDYEPAFCAYIGGVLKHKRDYVAMAQLSAAEQKSLSLGLDEAGGYLTPARLRTEVLSRLAARSVIRPYARVIETDRDTLRVPRFAPASATAGGLASGGASVFASGFVGTWASETPAFTDIDPSFGTFDISVKKARATTRITNDLVSDSAPAVLAWLGTSGGDNLALVEDFAFLGGDGGALQPRGILNSGITTVDVEGSTSNTISNTTGAPGSAPKVLDLAFAVPSQYRRNARWISTATSEKKVRQLVNAQGGYHFPVTDSGTLLGKPIDNSPFIEEDGADTRKVLLIADLSNYIIAQRSISVRVLSERFADLDQSGISVISRVGGAVWNDDGMRLGVV